MLLLRRLCRKGLIKTHYLPTNTLKYQLSNSQIHFQNILRGGNINQTISDVSNLEEKEREATLQLIVRGIFTGKVAPAVRDNSSFLKLAKQHPEIFISLGLFKVKQELKGLRQLMNGDTSKPELKSKIQEIVSRVDSTILECHQSFEKLPAQRSLRPCIQINTQFADYYQYYLFQLYAQQHKEKILQKAGKFYKNALEPMEILLTEEVLRIKELEAKKSQGKQAQQSKTTLDTQQINYLMILIEANAQKIVSLLKVITTLHHLRNNDSLYLADIQDVLPLLDKAINFFNIIEGCRTYSRFYHHLKQTKVRINFVQKLSPFTKDIQNPQVNQIWKVYREQLQGVWQESLQDLYKAGDRIECTSVVYEITAVALNVKLQQMRNTAKDVDEIRDRLELLMGIIQGKIRHSQLKDLVDSRMKVCFNTVEGLQNLTPKKQQ